MVALSECVGREPTEIAAPVRDRSAPGDVDHGLQFRGRRIRSGFLYKAQSYAQQHHAGHYGSGARVAGLETGELQGVEDVPTIAQKRIAANKDIRLLKLSNFWLNALYGNWSAPPTNNKLFRQAVLAALDFDEIMEAASDGDYKPNLGYQYPGTNYYTEVGKELLNQHDTAKAQRLLAEAGYKGEKVVLLTNKDYPSLYNSALVTAQQLKGVGINAELLVLDWPTALQ